MGYSRTSGGSVVDACSICGRCHKLKTGIGYATVVTVVAHVFPISIVNAESIQIEVEYAARPKFDGIEFQIGGDTDTHFIATVTYQSGGDGIIVVCGTFEYLHTIPIQTYDKIFKHVSTEQLRRSLDNKSCTDLRFRSIDGGSGCCPDTYNGGIGGNTCYIIIGDIVIGIVVDEVAFSRKISAFTYA